MKNENMNVVVNRFFFMKGNKTTEIKTRNANTPGQYFNLACVLDGKVVSFHNSKSYSDILALSNDFLQR